MQMAVPDAISFKEESEETKSMYGLDQDELPNLSGRFALPLGGSRRRAFALCRSITEERATHGTPTRI